MAHVHVIRAMDRNQDDAQVQLEACDALRDLADNDANQMTRQPKCTCASSARWTGTETTRKCR
jgi:hypothetical protein